MHPRNWVEISRGALRRNLNYVRGQMAAGTAVCAVVKADAYGHGAVACAREFTAGGAEWLAVTSAEEGARLRASGITGRVLVLAGFAPDEATALIEHQLTPAVWDAEQIAWLGMAMAGHPVETGFPIHLKLETGMGRLGITPAQEAGVAAALARTPQLRVEAVFSHLAASEAVEEEPNVRQQAAFTAAEARMLARLGIGGAGRHLLNSEGALRYPQWGGTLVRSGMALYGYSAQRRHAAALEPALSWKTRVVAVKDLPEGHGIGYGAQFRTPRPVRVATIAAGYADGYRRDFWPSGQVLIGSHTAPVVGNISMDLTTVDVTEAPGVRLGDEVILLGRTAAGAVTAVEMAEWAGTIPYEVLCGIAARVERSYVE